MLRSAVAKINGRTAKVIELPEVEARLSGLGFDPASVTPTQFLAVIRSEVEKWGRPV